MPPVGFDPTISAGERPQNYALDRTATGTGVNYILDNYVFDINYIVDINYILDINCILDINYMLDIMY